MTSNADKGKGQRYPTDSDIPAILEDIAGGASLRKACADRGINSSNADRFIEASSEWKRQYAHARDMRADLYGERGMTLAMAAATGQMYEGHKIDPSGARVALDAIKWHNGKMSPKRYGEKLTLGGDEDNPLTVQTLTARDRAKAMAALIAKQRSET